MVMEKKIPNQGGLLIFRKSKLLVTGSASDLIGPATNLFFLSIKSASFALQFLIDLSPKLYFVLFLSFLKLFQKSIMDDYDNRFLIVKSVFNNNLEQNSSLFNHSTYCWNLEFASLYSHSSVHASTLRQNKIALSNWTRLNMIYPFYHIIVKFASKLHPLIFRNLIKLTMGFKFWQPLTKCFVK